MVMKKGKLEKTAFRRIFKKIGVKLLYVPPDLERLLESLGYDWVVFKDFNAKFGARAGTFCEFVSEELSGQGWTGNFLEGLSGKA